MFQKTTMTKSEKDKLWKKVVEVGCMACLQNEDNTTPEIHHVKNYGRNDDKLVYGLCPTHHRPTHGFNGISNRHGNPKEFEEEFGTDLELYKKCMSLI